jgi:hypothetical protein
MELEGPAESRQGRVTASLAGWLHPFQGLIDPSNQPPSLPRGILGRLRRILRDGAAMQLQ